MIFHPSDAFFKLSFLTYSKKGGGVRPSAPLWIRPWVYMSLVSKSDGKKKDTFFLKRKTFENYNMNSMT